MARLKAIFDIEDRMTKRLKRITGDLEGVRRIAERPMTLTARDRATKVAERTSRNLSRLISRTHEMTITGRDMVTSKVLRPLASFMERRFPRVYDMTIRGLDRASPVIQRVQRIARQGLFSSYVLTLLAKDAASPVINRVTQLAKASFHRGFSLSVRTIDLASSGIRNISNFAGRNFNRAYTVTVKVLDLATRPLRAVANLATSTLGILGGAAGVYGTVISPLNMVMDRQGTTTAFEVLLGSAEAAHERVEELTKFAGGTPFARDDIFKSSRLLETFTGSALSTGEGLRLVGDVAAGTQTDFQDTAMWFGRLYDSMQSGRPIGDATSRLQEMGAISGESRANLERLAESGKDISEIWPEATKEFSKYNGMMEKLSDNLQNLLLGTKQFFVQNMMMKWGEGLSSALTPALASFRDWRGENAQAIREMGHEFERLGQRAANAVLNPMSRVASFMGDQFKVLFPVNDMMREFAIHDPDLMGYVTEMDNQGFDARLNIVMGNTKDALSDWWDTNGQSNLNGLTSGIGGIYGGFLRNVLLGALGLEGESTGNAFVDAGLTAGKSFVDSFIGAFQPMDIAKKIGSKLWDVNWNFVTAPSGDSFGKALLGNAIAAFVASKLITAFAPVAKPLGKGFGKLGKGLWGLTGKKALESRRNKDTRPNPVYTRGPLGKVEPQPKKGFLSRLFGSGSNNNFMSGGGMGVASKLFRPLSLGMSLLDIFNSSGDERNSLIGGSLGGIGGMMAGGATGAAIGTTIAPGIGTAIGGVIGSILGGIGGEQIGKWLADSNILGQIQETLFNGEWWSEKWNSVASFATSTVFNGSWWAEQAGFIFGVLESSLFSGDWWIGKWESVKGWTSSKWEETTVIWDNAIESISNTLFSSEWWIGQWEGVKGWTSEKWDSYKSIWTSVKTDISDTLFSSEWWLGKWEAVRGWASSTLSWLGEKASGVVSSFTAGRNKGNATPQKYARGGLITNPHLGLVGEAGPEMIIPLSGHRSRALSLWEQAGAMLGASSAGGSVQVPNEQVDAVFRSRPTGGNSRSIRDININFNGENHYHDEMDAEKVAEIALTAVEKALDDDDFEGGDVHVG